MNQPSTVATAVKAPAAARAARAARAAPTVSAWVANLVHSLRFV